MKDPAARHRGVRHVDRRVLAAPDVARLHRADDPEREDAPEGRVERTLDRMGARPLERRRGGGDPGAPRRRLRKAPGAPVRRARCGIDRGHDVVVRAERTDVRIGGRHDDGLRVVRREPAEKRLGESPRLAPLGWNPRAHLGARVAAKLLDGQSRVGLHLVVGRQRIPQERPHCLDLALAHRPRELLLFVRGPARGRRQAQEERNPPHRPEGSRLVVAPRHCPRRFRSAWARISMSASRGSASVSRPRVRSTISRDSRVSRYRTRPRGSPRSER